jgi:hypothetical protein
MTCEKSLAQIEKDFETIRAEQSVNPPSSA